MVKKYSIFLFLLVIFCIKILSDTIPDNEDRKISDYVASIRISDEYWPQYIIVQNNHVNYPIRIEVDVIYCIVHRRNQPDHEKEATLYSGIILPMSHGRVNLNIRGNYIVRIKGHRVVAFVD